MSPKTSQRRQHSAAEKVAILRSHLLEGRPVSDVCDEHGINPTLFYRWQKELFEGGHAVFERRGGEPAMRQAEKRIEVLERKLRQKDEVLGEVMAEYVAVKKTLGGV
jgi:transposase